MKRRAKDNPGRPDPSPDPGKRAGTSADVLVADDLLRIPTAPPVPANPNVLARLTELGFSQSEITDLVLPKRMFAPGNAADEALTAEQTDRALRLERIAAIAERVFGDSAKAHRWLRKPKHELRDETPLAFLASESGERLVEEMLIRIEHGMF
jgi:putative toxin-antitoxin system antitoxin component (TIGR02293 family)